MCRLGAVDGQYIVYGEMRDTIIPDLGALGDQIFGAEQCRVREQGDVRRPGRHWGRDGLEHLGAAGGASLLCSRTPNVLTNRIWDDSAKTTAT